MKKFLFTLAMLCCSYWLASGLNVTLTLTCYIEGYYDLGQGQMQPVLADPNCGSYAATDVSTSIVELYDSNYPNGPNSTNPVPNGTSTSGILQTNGMLVCNFTNLTPGNYYIAIKMPRALETWSNAAESFTATSVSYDFSSANTQSNGPNEIKVDQIGLTEYWAIYSGDVDQDGDVDVVDFNLVDTQNQLGFFNCPAMDLNGDGYVATDDVVLIDNIILSGGGLIGVKRP